MLMNVEQKICANCGREVAPADVAVESERGVMCKCCAYDKVASQFEQMLTAISLLSRAVKASSGYLLAFVDVLNSLPPELLEQLKADDDADNTEADKEELSATEGDAGAQTACE